MSNQYATGTCTKGKVSVGDIIPYFETHKRHWWSKPTLTCRQLKVTLVAVSEDYDRYYGTLGEEWPA